MTTYNLIHSHMNCFFRRIQAVFNTAISLLRIRKKQKAKTDIFEIELDEKEIIIEDYYW